MKNEPGEIAGKPFDQLVRGVNGTIIAAAEKPVRRRPSGANFVGGLAVPELRHSLETVVRLPAEGEGEG